MVASYTSPQTGWHFLTVIDQDEIFAPAYQMIRWSVIVALLMVVVFVAVGTIIARRITDPINHVSSSLSRIVEGGADLNKTLDVRSRDEIGKLAGHFNSFLASVKLKQQDAIRDQKLEAVGQLSAGIAHEINTPAQFVGDNITFLGQSFDDLWSLLTEYERQMANIEAGGDVAGSMVIIRDAVEKIDMEFLGKELPDAIRESAKGIERINTIVHAMKEFTHPGSDDPQCVDLNRAVQSTVTMARSEWRYCAELDMRLDPDLPHVDCYAGDINQAILNIVVNAAHAIEDKRIQIGAAELGTISIETMHDDDTVTIRIADSGKGVEKADIHRIFNPFFTTREVGKGTGQGLAIAFRAIVDRHKGKLEVDSVAGQGATFTIVLPRHKPVPEDSSIDIAVPALALT
jgi:signal transduction histidine kinase